MFMQPADDSIAADLPEIGAPAAASVPSPDLAAVPSFMQEPPAASLQPPPAMPAVAPPPAAPQHLTQLPESFRSFEDIDKTRDLIFQNMMRAAQEIEEVKNSRHSLRVENPRWMGPDRYSLAEQKKAILSRGTLGRKLVGDLVLRDAAGNEIDRKNTQLAKVPYMTPRGTFIVNGSEYTMSHQLRLRPGVFTRVKQNGELESHVNVAKGYSHRIELDPQTGIFKVNIGQAHIQLLPLLKAMGVTNSQLQDAWGSELTSANVQKEDTHAMRKLHEKLFRDKSPDETGGNAGVVKAFNEMVLDPDVTKRTLGQGFSNVGADTLLAITKKLLRVSRQEDEPDDRDAMPYQTLPGPEDIFAERMRKAKNLLRTALWKASGRGNLKNTSSNLYDEAIRAGLLTSGLGQPLSEINPAEIFDQRSRVTRMGEGGITSMDSVPDECYDDETEVFTAKGWMPWSRADLSTEFACMLDGRLEYHRPYRVLHQLYDGQMYGITTRTLDCLVTAGHRHWVRKYRSTSSVQRCGEAAWGYELAADVHRRPRQFMVSHLPFLGATMTCRVTLPCVAGARHAFDFDAGDWAELVGWYISEGSIDSYALRVRKKYCITISQDSEANRENVQRIAALLTRMGIAHSYQGKNFVFVSKQLGVWLTKNCGVKCANKMIPEECFFWSHISRSRLLSGLVSGDGSLRDNGSGVYTSKSQRLVDQVARLAVTLGIAASNRRAYTRIDKRLDRSNEPVTGCACGLLISQTQGVTSERMYAESYYTCRYNGYVHCAEVPGGLLFVRRHGSIGMWSGNSRAVQPSQFGFIDAIRTPESGRVGVDSRIARATVKGENGQIYTKVRLPDGTVAYKTPQEFADATVAFPQEMQGPNSEVAVLQRGKFTMAPRSEVDFEVPDNEDTFSPLGNMVAMKSMVKGQRAVMAARMMTQAMALKNPEAPYMQSGVPGEPDTSFEQKYSKHMGALRADVPARITAITNDSIEMVDGDGKKHTLDLYHNFPLNQKSYLHQTPTVQVGDVVKPGQLLARSNFTDAEGTTALGLNARVAYIPWDGLNFEDAIAVSESFAKRASSEHMYQHLHEWEDTEKQGLNNFKAIFPAEYSKETLDKFDSNGVIKPGTRVKQGDPLILIARTKEMNKKSLLRGSKPMYQNASQTWDSSDDGEVTDVVNTPKGTAVVVKATMPMQVGDKAAGRYGDKGVVAKIIPDDQMPTDTNGKPFEVLLNPLGVTSRCYDEQTEFLTDRGWVYGRDVTPTDKFACYHVWTEGLFLMDQLHEFHVADYSGKMLLFQNKMIDFCVTPNHRMWAACGYPGAPWQEVTADRIANRKGWKVPVAGLPVPGVDTPFTLPHSQYHAKDTASDRGDIVVDAGDWAEFLGWYIAEGNVDEKVHISQSNVANPENCRRIESLLSRLPFAWHYNEQNIQYHITSKRLCEYLRPLGLCATKRIPAWLFSQSPATRDRFLDGYLRGDGTKDPTVRAERTGGYNGAGTMSENLASDLQRLFVLQGRSANMSRHACGIWRVGIHAMRHRILEKQNWRTIDYDGKIYCPTVPTGYIVTRRNGKILIAGNTNPAQILEATLGKIAAITGKPYRIPDDGAHEDLVEYGLKELQKHGLPDTEDVIDPRNGRRIKNMLTGNRWMMKLHHTAESKGQGRGLGTYTAEGTPAKGGPEGAKRLGMLESNALLSHGATTFLRNSSLIRGQSNPQLWAQYMSGNKMPTGGIPHVYQKYVNSLRASGINVRRDGTRLNIMALTDKDIAELAGDREIKNTETVDWRTMEPIKGGLFDTALTGGHATGEGGGNRWSFIKLHEPLPNPVMEEPIRRVLGLTTTRFDAIMSGKEQLNNQTGPTAIAAALDKINLPAELQKARAEIAGTKKTARDAAVRRLNYLKSAERLNIHPRDWVLSRVPVLPPAFRPVSTMGANKLPLVADANYLYKELFDANAGLSEIAKQLDPADLGDERMAVYNAFKAVTGLGDPTHAKNQERGVKGILKHVLGTSPKTGMVQRRLIGSSTDLVGRSVIVPDPDLDMDQVGVPENQAWTIYRPILIHKLVRKGMPRVQAAKSVEERSQAARAALIDEMDNGVVVINRAPTLHRYGIMAAKPKLVKGDVLKVSPLVVGGFGADFDGDAMQYHVPVTDEEKQEVMEKMLPSKNLFSAATFKVHQLPSQEYVGGLYNASVLKDDKNRPLVFDTAADAIRAYRKGEIGVDRQVQILHH